ncbi:MAG: hypothetical protein JO076_03360, partial [Verrucomicrobia bacterium]|nr:hypothetical protein [Verrucomicrobiota bacterium]
YFFPGRIEVRQASGMLCGTHLNISGTLVNPSAFRLSPGPPAARNDQASKTFLQTVLKELQAMNFEREPPELTFNFQIDFADPKSLRVQSGRLSASRFERNRYRFQSLEGTFSLENYKLELQRLLVRGTSGELSATGTWDLLTNERSLRLNSSLNLADLLADEPRLPWIKEWRFQDPPKLELSGRTKSDGVLFLLGKLDFDRFSFRDIPFQSLRADFSKFADEWMILNAELTHRSGTVSGDLLHLPGNFHGRINSALNPTELSPLFTNQVREALTDWQFIDPPLIQLNVSGPDSDFNSLSGAGELWLGQTRLRGELMNSGSTRFQLQRGEIVCNQVRVNRDEGAAFGGLAYDCKNDEVSLHDIQAKLTPSVLAGWMEPYMNVSKILQSFRFANTPTIRADGKIQLKLNKIQELGFEVDSPSQFTYRFGAIQIPFNSGIGKFRLLPNHLTGELMLPQVDLKETSFFAPLISKLQSIGSNERFDVQIAFQVDANRVQVNNLTLVSGPHIIELGGALSMPETRINLAGTFDQGLFRVRCEGSLLKPVWKITQ